MECYIWNIVLCGAENRTLRKVYHKYLESFEVWCWRRMEKIICNDHVKSKVSRGVKEERNTLRTIKSNTNWIYHILCRNCLLKHVIEGKIEATGRRGRGRKQLRKRRHALR
jgi:hypothetical protein